MTIDEERIARIEARLRAVEENLGDIIVSGEVSGTELWWGEHEERTIARRKQAADQRAKSMRTP